MFKKSFGAVFGTGIALLATLAVAAVVLGGGFYLQDWLDTDRKSRKVAVEDNYYVCSLIEAEFGRREMKTEPLQLLQAGDLNSIEFDPPSVVQLRERMYLETVHYSDRIRAMRNFCATMPPISAAERYAIEVRRRTE